MAFPNVTDLVATTLDSRTKEVADNVTKNNAGFVRMNEKGKIKTVSGGVTILHELSYAENGNFGWYTGYDLLSVAAQDVISAAQFAWKQAAVPVVISGLEKLQNSGREAMLDLLDTRIGVAESTMANQMASAFYGDGTAYGGKALTGLGAAIVSSPSTGGSYGGIDRNTWAFWRNQTQSSSGASASTIQAMVQNLLYKQTRGKDRPDLGLFDNNLYSYLQQSMQVNQRFTDSKLAEQGFMALKYMGMDCVLDGGLGGYCPANTAYFLNTDYLMLRPHKDRNMVALSPNGRQAVNQDAEVTILAWAGNLTCSNVSLQGYLGT